MFNSIKIIWIKFRVLIATAIAAIGVLYLASKYKKKSDSKSTISPKRIDENGKLIPVGESDSKGYTQISEDGTIEDGGLLSDENIVVLKDNEKEKGIELPIGIENEDIGKVIKIELRSNEIKNLDSPTVDTGKLIEELSKL